MTKVLFITFCAVILSIGVHYITLLFATKFVGKFHGVHPASIIIILLIAVFAHVIEIFIFAMAFQLMFSYDLAVFSIENPSFMDIFYFSGTTYTTVGFGDIIVYDDVRITTVVESVMGLVLIAWTASFTYFEMNRKWIRQ